MTTALLVAVVLLFALSMALRLITRDISTSRGWKSRDSDVVVVAGCCFGLATLLTYLLTVVVLLVRINL